MQMVICRVHNVPFCCGAREVGSMTVVPYNEDYNRPSSGFFVGVGKTKKLAAADLLQKLVSQGHYSLQFWFKRPHSGGYNSILSSMKEEQYSKNFVAQELLDAVVEAGGLTMARYLNPNTMNELYGIILTTNCVSLKE